MKLVLVSLVTALTLSGCIVISNKPNPTKPYQSNVIDFKPSEQANRVTTKGQVICEASKPCPELTFDWQQQANGLYKVRTDIYDREKFTIQSVSFKLDGQNYPYTSTGQTSQRAVLNSDMTNSANFLEVPKSFIDSFNKAKAIDFSIITDKGEITYSILKDGKESFAYKTFQRGYAQNSNP